MDQSFYDLLVMMNERAMPDRCVIQLIDGGARTRCDDYGKPTECCPDCIAAWMNEAPF